MTMENNIISRFKIDKPALLLVSIGPVQEFITEACKMRDLWVGSYLLSMVTSEAMLPILEKYGHEAIIMPYIADSKMKLTYATLPNHFIAIVPQDEVDNITKEIKKRVEGLPDNSVKGFLEKLGEGVKEQIDKIVPKYSKWADLWDFQIKDHFKVMWVSLSISPDSLKDNDYQAKYNELQRFMEERKNTRIFSSWQGNTAAKCSQCGHREVMGPPEFGENNKFWKLLRRNEATKYRLNKSERLCAICLLKRLIKENKLCDGMPDVTFDSTSDIASMPFRKKLFDYKNEGVTINFLQNLSELNKQLERSEIKRIDDIPGEWFYKEGLEADRIGKDLSVNVDNDLKKKAKAAQDGLDKVYSLLKDKPSKYKYYAILMMDGDKMGELLSGGVNGKMPGEEIFSLDWQMQQSKKLSALGLENWPKIIQEWDGATIYSGGDDLLAFGPLQGALLSADRIRKAFRGSIKGTTISGCLVIVHHNDSLRWALEEARNGIARAKDLYDRNALVITLKVSSGTVNTCGYKWDIDTDKTLIEDFILCMTGWLSMKKSGLSRAFIFDMLNELPAFYWNRGEKIFLKTPDMLKIECSRLLKRHIPEKSPLWEQKDKIEKLIDLLLVLANPEKHTFDATENLESLLKLMDFLARGED